MDETTISDSYSFDRSLNRCPDARELTVVGGGIEDLGGLIRFRNLERLNLVGLYHTGTKPEFHDTLSDFSDASSLKSVRVLTVRDCRGFDDAALEVVAQMPKLEAFMLDSFMATVAGFEPLQFAKRLLCLCVTVCPRELADTMPPGIECILSLIHI